MNDNNDSTGDGVSGEAMSDGSVDANDNCSRSLYDLRLRMREFVSAREWQVFHTPKNLAMALAGEAGELAAEFQWLSQAESADLKPSKRDQVRFEMADVLIYLVRLADELDIDLLEAAADKLVINESRYPAHLVKGKAAKYNEYDLPSPNIGEADPT